MKAGKFDEAAREIEAELAINPADVQAKYNLGYVLLARQETDRGVGAEAKAALTPAEVEAKVAALRKRSVKFRDTVAAPAPTLNSRAIFR